MPLSVVRVKVQLELLVEASRPSVSVPASLVRRVCVLEEGRGKEEKCPATSAEAGVCRPDDTESGDGGGSSGDEREINCVKS